MQLDSVKVVSFSGIDGAGKSTQIEALCNSLRARGFRCATYTFWDDVVAFSKLREHISLRAFKGDEGIGSPAKPIVRRDKNVATWYMTIFRLFLYMLDAFSLSVAVSRRAESDADFLIFDRYIYDEWVNLPMKNPIVRLYICALLRFTPQPDVSLFLDADPEAATIRKPEYPLEFVRRNRDAYHRISRLVGMTVVPPRSIEQTSRIIGELVSEKCQRTNQHTFQCASEDGAASLEAAPAKASSLD
jgi:thymidylate kinase